MADIKKAMVSMPSPDKDVMKILIDYYEGMKALESDALRAGKQATLIVMTLNDVLNIFNARQ